MREDDTFDHLMELKQTIREGLAQGQGDQRDQRARARLGVVAKMIAQSVNRAR